MENCFCFGVEFLPDDSVFLFVVFDVRSSLEIEWFCFSVEESQQKSSESRVSRVCDKAVCKSIPRFLMFEAQN